MKIWIHSDPENGENGVDPERRQLDGCVGGGRVSGGSQEIWGQKRSKSQVYQVSDCTPRKRLVHVLALTVYYGEKIEALGGIPITLTQYISGHCGLEPRNPYSWARLLPTIPIHFQVWMEEESITWNKMMPLDWMIFSAPFSTHKYPGIDPMSFCGSTALL